MRFHQPREAECRRQPDREARSCQEQHFAHHQPDHRPAGRAQRHPDTDLPRPPRHHEGHHTVKSDSRKQRGQAPENARERSQQPFRHQGILHLRVKRPHFIHRHARIHFANGSPQRAEEAHPGGFGAHIGGHAVDPVLLDPWHVQLVRDFLPHVFVLGVANDADDFNVRLGSWVAAESHVAAERIGIAEIALGELLVYDPDFRSALAIFDGEIAPKQNGNLQCLEKSRRAELHVRIGNFALLRSVAFNGHPIVPFVVHQHRDDGKSHGLDAGQRFEPLRQLPVILAGPVRFVPVQSRFHGNRNQVLGLEAGMEFLQVIQTLKKESRADQKQQRERYLGHHQALAQPRRRPAGHRAGFVL